MPLPFLPWLLGAAAVGLAGSGVANGAKAIQKNKQAQNVNERAQSICKRAETAAQNARNRSNNCLKKLGQAKLDILDKNMTRFINIFEQIHSIELKETAGMKELKGCHLDKQELAAMREMSSMAASMLGGLVTGAGAGALTAFGAYGATMAFGAASTGTAIASLSGAAATNATLAFLGGGALAAGGGGMALGSVVLGGAVAGPALAILGGIMNASASKNLDNAYSNLAEAEKLAEELKVVRTLCNAIAERADMFVALIKNLDIVFGKLTDKLERIVLERGCDYSLYATEEQEVVAMSLGVAKAVKQVLDTPILDKEGNLTKESQLTLKEADEQTKQYTAELQTVTAKAEIMPDGFVLTVLSGEKICGNAYLVKVEVNNANISEGDCCCTYSNKRFKIIDIPGGMFMRDGVAFEGRCTTICILAEEDCKLDEASLYQMDKTALDANSVLLKEDSYEHIKQQFRAKLRNEMLRV